MSFFPRFDRKMPAIGQPDLEPGQSESHAETRALDDARAERCLEFVRQSSRHAVDVTLDVPRKQESGAPVRYLVS